MGTSATKTALADDEAKALVKEAFHTTIQSSTYLCHLLRLPATAAAPIAEGRAWSLHALGTALASSELETAQTLADAAAVALQQPSSLGTLRRLKNASRIIRDIFESEVRFCDHLRQGWGVHLAARHPHPTILRLMAAQIFLHSELILPVLRVAARDVTSDGGTVDEEKVVQEAADTVLGLLAAAGTFMVLFLPGILVYFESYVSD